MHQLSTSLLLFLFLTVVNSIKSQNNASDTVSISTRFKVQIEVVQDSAKEYESLMYQSIIKESISKKRYCYSLGYFDSIDKAEFALDYLKRSGYKEAFIRKEYNLGAAPNDFIKRDKRPLELYNDYFPSQTYLQLNAIDTSSINLTISGKSFGVLGNTRSQEEHELLTNYANLNKIDFKLVSHACWKAKGITVMFPSDEPIGDELAQILSEKNRWELIENISGLVTNDVLLFQDLERAELDMLDIIRSDDRISTEFPEIKECRLNLYKTILDGDKLCFIVLEEDFYFPESDQHWIIGEFNRVDFEKTSRLYEIPFLKGGFGERASLFKFIDRSIKNNIKIDLGHRHADLNVSMTERSHLDFDGLDALGYDIVVPYINEFLLGIERLRELRMIHDDLKMLATNVKLYDKNDIFHQHVVITIDSTRIGFVGLVDPQLTLNLPEDILQEFTIIDPIIAAQIAVDSLHKIGVDAIIGLSNMSVSDNARLADKVIGMDVITTDFVERGEQKGYINKIVIDSGVKRGLSSPFHISSIPDYGVGIGNISMNFIEEPLTKNKKLNTITELNHIVDERILSDYDLLDTLLGGIAQEHLDKGELLIPAFVDIIEQKEDLQNFDQDTENGRISKSLWESFMARLLTTGIPAEISIIRPLDSFLPLIGKLHEREVRSWLWFEDDIVLIDLKGRDVKRLLNSQSGQTLVTGGVEAFRYPGGAYYKVMGRPLIDDVYYRVATTNVICNGTLKEFFHYGLRKSDQFIIQPNGILKDSKVGDSVSLKEYILKSLREIRSKGKGKSHHSRIANIFLPDSPYEKLFSFNFVKPTLWTSLNRSYRGEGYDAIPESRIISNNSFVIGVGGGINTTYDTEKSQWNLGFQFAFAEQSAEIADGITQITENADDININLSYQFKGKNPKKLHPYLRMEYDTEFTPTINTSLDIQNPKQRVLRNIFGMSKSPSAKWPILEVGANAENDLSNDNYQYGLQGRSLGRFPLDKEWNVVYSLTNNFNYYLPNKDDTNRDLAFKYNMIHELQVPLFGDISLTVAADLFFFQGKTDLNSEPGMSMLMKVGLTYNRLWKPRFQSLF